MLTGVDSGRGGCMREVDLKVHIRFRFQANHVPYSIFVVQVLILMLVLP